MQPDYKQPQQPTFIVNYVWMAEDPANPTSIPSHFFYSVQKNAAKYPEIEFRVWGESETIAQEYEMPNNVRINRLSDIPSFSSMPLFTNRLARDIWPTVDMARLLVIQHVLIEHPLSIAIYSDFDVKDVSIRSWQLKERLEKYGCAFTGAVNPSTRKLTDRFENSYFAFSQKGTKLLECIIDKGAGVAKAC